MKQRYGKPDTNHAQVKGWYRELGCAVADTKDAACGVPDIFVGCAGITDAVEIKTDDGTLTPVEVSDTILSHRRWVGFVRDISRRRQLEDEFARSTEQLRAERNFVDAILDTAATLIVVLDHDARVVRFNKACEAATGVSQSDLHGKTIWLDLVPAEERDGVERVANRLRSGEPFVEYENHWLHRDGSRRLIRWRNTLIKEASGVVRFLIATGTDVTVQVKAEDQARQHLEEASRLQRLQTANELATMLAHELNQPLAAIAAYAAAGQQLLRRPEPDADKLAETLEKISRQALRAGEAIRHLRAFVARGRMNPVPLDLNAVVRRACALFSPRARGSGVGIEMTLDEGLAPVGGVDVQWYEVRREQGITTRLLAVLNKRIEDPIQGIALSPDGRLLLISHLTSGLELWEVSRGKESLEWSNPAGDEFCAWGADLSPDGRLLATGTRNGFIRIWELATGR